MQLSHWGHACVLIDTGSTRLLLDPGTMSTGFEDLTGLDGILITHQHADHLDEQRLPALLAANPKATVFVDEGTAATAEGKGFAFEVLRPGDHRTIGSATVDVVGGDHAIIHPDIPKVANNGYLIEGGAFYHPGDSLFVPEQDVDVLGMPVSGPWLKLGETIDFVRAVTPRVAVPIHEAVMAQAVAPMMVGGLLGNLKPEKTTLTMPAHGETVTL